MKRPRPAAVAVVEPIARVARGPEIRIRGAARTIELECETLEDAIAAVRELTETRGPR